MHIHACHVATIWFVCSLGSNLLFRPSRRTISTSNSFWCIPKGSLAQISSPKIADSKDGCGQFDASPAGPNTNEVIRLLLEEKLGLNTLRRKFFHNRRARSKGASTTAPSLVVAQSCEEVFPFKGGEETEDTEGRRWSFLGAALWKVLRAIPKIFCFYEGRRLQQRQRQMKGYVQRVAMVSGFTLRRTKRTTGPPTKIYKKVRSENFWYAALLSWK